MSKKNEETERVQPEVVTVSQRLVEVPKADSGVATPFQSKPGIKHSYQEAQERTSGVQDGPETVSGL